MERTPIIIVGLPQDYVNQHTLCHNIVQRDHGLLDILKNITLMHNIDDIMWVGQAKQEVANTIMAKMPACW